MIHHISIKNFAIIEHAEVDFHDGLNIVTGETGSGKSILIEAVSLALGSRADSSCIRQAVTKRSYSCSASSMAKRFSLQGRSLPPVRIYAD